MKLPKPDFNKNLSEWRGAEFTYAVLYTIAIGGIVVIALTAPNAVQILKLFKAKTPKEQKRVLQKIRNSVRSGYLEKSDAGYVVSKKGKELLNEESVWEMEPKKPARWDGIWHIVLFDIPGKKERARQALRARLDELGFKPYQNSVFIHKYDMREILDPFARFYGIRGGLRFGTIRELDGVTQLFERKKR